MTLTAISMLVLAACSQSDDHAPAGPHIDSLTQLTTEALRARRYGSTIEVEKPVDLQSVDSYMASYESDGLRLYTRVDIPDEPQPDDGYPVVVFVHGWTGIEGAPEYDFFFRAQKDYATMVNAYAEAGFVVFTPGWRGHGTVDGVPADGIEFLRAFDNGSYLSPVFYAIDVLNLIDGLGTFGEVKLDLSNINLSAHSQGGDVALISLAIAGEGSMLRNDINAASIWSGTFPHRFTQVRTFHPMASTPAAFLSGDGSWTGTAVAADGSVNPNWVFGYPADWIETIETNEWTWQRDTWSLASVSAAVTVKLDQMYDAINEYVADIDDAVYQIATAEDQSFTVLHDERVAAAMSRIGAFGFPQFLTEPLALQHSDRDYYSFPAWNADLCQRANEAGGRCYDFEYAENTHALHVSTRTWFSSESATPGFAYALRRDIALFGGEDPTEIHFPERPK